MVSLFGSVCVASKDLPSRITFLAFLTLQLERNEIAL